VALVVGEWSALRSSRFSPGERAPGTLSIGGWVGPTAGLDYVEKKISRNYRDSNSGPPVVQPVVSRYTDFAIPTLTIINNVIFKNNGQVPAV
jgi:hypothetical protein